MTTTPQTLLQIAGAPAHPSPPDRSALVLIDHQLEYLGGGVPLSGIEAAIGELERLLRLARDGGVPVFHIVHHGKPGAALFDPLGPHAEIIASLAPRDGETVVVKSLPNAFAGTDLRDRIAATGRGELIIAGFATHMCVSATARASLDLGFRNNVVAAATATRDLPDWTGVGVISAATIQQASLAALADRFAVIVPDASALGSTWRG